MGGLNHPQTMSSSNTPMTESATDRHVAISVPHAATPGQTFTERGRRYVVIESRSILAEPDDPPSGLKAVEIAEDIPLTEIAPSPFNRKHFDEQRLREMADSLNANGQLETAVVRLLGHSSGNGVKYELVAGERRWRGCELAGLPFLRCHVRDLSDGEAAEQLLLSNLEREDLTPIEEAETFQQLLALKDDTGKALYSLERIAERVFGNGKKRSRVARALKLLNLPKTMRQALDEGRTSASVAFLVGRLADPKAREEAAKEILKPRYRNETMSVKEAEQFIAETFQVSLKGALFDLQDASLVEVKLDEKGHRQRGGACVDCPHLAKNNPAYEIATGDNRKAGAGGTSGVDAMTCTNAACHELKLEALWQRQAAEIVAKEPGLQIVPRAKSGKWFSPFHDGLDWNAPMVLLTDAANQGEKRLPWAKVLKGTEVPILLACNRKGAPVRLADKALAQESLKRTHPELARDGGPAVNLSAREMEDLKKEASATGATLMTLVDRARKEKEAELRRKEELTRKIEGEATLDALRELLPAMSRKGLTDDAAILYWRRMTGLANWTGDDVGRLLDLQEKELNHIEGLPARRGMRATEILALLIVLELADDVRYSGLENAAEVKQMLKLYGVDHAAIRARVKKAHELAEREREREKAEKSKLEAEARAKKAPKEPAVSTAHEAEITAASDALYKQEAQGKGKAQGKRPKAGGKGEEELHTCPKCGQGNFTAKGLKAHNCAKRVGGAGCGQEEG